ncbi:hypothetical protein FGIG_09538, partial [Fasciola gigantica]
FQKSLKASSSNRFSVPVCVVVQFVNLGGRRKRSISRQKRATTSGVSSITTFAFPDSTADNIEGNAFSSLVTSGFSQLSPGDRALVDETSIQVAKTFVVATCESSRSTCSSQATCTDETTGFSCTCNAFFIERRNTTPGTVCDLHPGTIAFIVLGSLFVVLMVALMAYFITLHMKGKPVCPLCPREDNVHFEVK